MTHSSDASGSPVAPPVEPATGDDLDGILKLQYLCYQTEATRYDAWHLDPLTETSAQLREAHRTGRLLVCRVQGEVVGSVRAQTVLDAAGQPELHLGRLVVHPRFRRRGMARRLLRCALAQAPQGTPAIFYTGHRSTEYLQMLGSEGFVVRRREEISPVLTLVHLRRDGDTAP